jgi:4-amino-4-deoxy-L-arabinose transferase-like glycosyltransferase
MRKYFSIPTYRYLLLILASAFLLRMALAFYLGNTVTGLSGGHDEISYSMLGERFASGHGMTFPEDWYPWIKADAPQSYFSYSISFYLGTIYTIFGYQPLIARLITGLLSTGLVLMIFLVAREFFDERVALISSAIAAGYAYLIFYGVTLLTETPFMLALLIAIYVALKLKEKPTLRLWVLLGLSLAVTVLLRMAVIAFVPLLLLWVAFEIDRRSQLKMLLIPAGLIVLAILPFTIRNYLLWDQFMLLEAQFGHVFWNGNHPNHQGDFHPYEVFDIPAEVLALNNDAQITSRFLRMGVQNVLDDPRHFVLLVLTRLRELFKFWPTEDSSTLANLLRLFSFGLILPFTIIGLLLNLRHWRRLAPIFLFILIHTSIYAVTWTMIRYRIPLDIFFIMFAAYTINMAYLMLYEGTSRESLSTLHER